jgi:Transcription factor WhiB
VGEPERAPNLRNLFAAALDGWRGEAACRDEPDPDLFLSDKRLPRSNPGSPTLALALAICASCPVRRDCLDDALTPVHIVVERGNDFPTTLGGTMAGVWGGTTEDERMTAQNAGLSVDQAAEVFERTFPERLARQVRLALADKSPDDGYRKRRERLRRLLAEQQVTPPVAVTGDLVERVRRGRCCVGCGDRLPALARSDARFCGVRCRVAAHRARAA